MPKRYHLETSPTPPRFVAPGPTCLLDWEEGCLKCARCVKLRCNYDVFRNRRIDPISLADTADSLCRNCLSCVQNCPNRLITKAVNPEYRRMGDAYWTPDVLTRIYYQADTGLIPVSGGGYGGPFSGDGFDAMWTDMSEIVRPTRDGIHGREYISTLVDLGRKPESVPVDGDLREADRDASYVESPVPFILEVPRNLKYSASAVRVLMAAARDMEAFALIPAGDIPIQPGDADPYVIPSVPALSDWPPSLDFDRFRLVQIDDGHGLEAWLGEFKAQHPDIVVMIRLPFAPGFAARLAPLVGAGADILHLYADDWGCQPRGGIQPGGPLRLKDLIRQAHLTLVEAGLRDRITLLAAGGLALAEHVAKAIICGVDAVVVDQAVWAALECRICPDCRQRPDCPADIDAIPEDWGKRRVINLLGAWRNQLLEVLGAMGLREIRRLRGEVGRAMFFEQLEEESFGPIFGRRKR